MSGHSKWHNIQMKKGKNDAARANVFTKIGREIAVAVKAGGPDPNSNAKLRDVIAKAKAANMPNDNIQRGIKKAAGDGENINYVNNVYEGYAPGGIAMIVDTLTHREQKTLLDRRPQSYLAPFRPHGHEPPAGGAAGASSGVLHRTRDAAGLLGRPQDGGGDRDPVRHAAGDHHRTAVRSLGKARRQRMSRPVPRSRASGTRTNQMRDIPKFRLKKTPNGGIL